jgi:hypothetical protein
MTSPLARRRKPRTTFGKLIRAWPKIRLAIRVARFIARARLAIQVALFTLAVVAIGRLIRRRRRRRGTEPLTSSAPPPVPTAAPRPVPPVDADPPTETERNRTAEQ